MSNALEIAKRRVERSKWIPVGLLALLLAYGCATHRNAAHYRGETFTPTIQAK